MRRIVIVAGFQGYNSNLDITTLGRGGSDTTAVALAASLNASHCYIFSDVDGVYTLDPNKFPEAKKLEAISYDEMLNISNEGAKVLHNRCIEIAQKFDIPIIAKSTFNNNSGTVINSNIEEGVVKSIVFCMTLSLVACYNGDKTKNGAVGIKNSTISTVVKSCVYILMFNFIITFIMG